MKNLKDRLDRLEIELIALDESLTECFKEFVLLKIRFLNIYDDLNPPYPAPDEGLILPS